MFYETFHHKQKIHISVTNLTLRMSVFIANTCLTTQIMMTCSISQCACCESSRIPANAFSRQHSCSQSFIAYQLVKAPPPLPASPAL